LSAPLPYTVYSDSYDHKSYIRGLVKSGFGGHLWTPEVRDAKSVEDLVRRIQTVIFSPYAMVNCWYMQMPPWLQIDADKSNAGQLMPEAKEATRLVREAFRLRMSLIPYLYSAFNEYHETGNPVVRPLTLDYPDDANLAKIDDQFMFGPSLMVAPMVEGESKRSVYFPRGNWVDFYTDERIEGGRRVDITKPVEQIPLYIKDNTLLPRAGHMTHVGKDAVFEIRVQVVGDHPAPFTLYEDDGESFDYEKGAQNKVVLTWTPSGGSVVRTGKFKIKRYDIVEWRHR
jgi:alpha-D-xyloside xylohydrolase